MISRKHRVALRLMGPFRSLPNGKIKKTIRSNLWRFFGAPPIPGLEWFRIPRKDILIDSGETVVMVGLQSASRLHFLRRLIGPDGQAIIIEPEPNNYSELSKAMEEYENIRIIKKAAWNKTGELDLHFGEEGSARVTDNPEQWDFEYNSSETVDSERLDEIINKYQIEPDYLEVTVAGTELMVLQGATETLSNHSPRLIVKNYGAGTDIDPSIRTDIEAVYELLQRAGYKIISAPMNPNPQPYDPYGDLFAYKIRS